jgi:predicted molibdopterin-dependent oxidoreductase YjgC
MYKRLPDLAATNPNARLLAVTIDGKPFTARDGDTVAATLLAAGLVACRTTPVSGSARGPFCMMGVCFDCLVVIDGRANQQGCMIPAAEGMKLELQQGARVVPVAPDSAMPGAIS